MDWVVGVLDFEQFWAVTDTSLTSPLVDNPDDFYLNYREHKPGKIPKNTSILSGTLFAVGA